MPSPRSLLLLAAGAVAAATAGPGAAEEPSAARRETLIHRLSQDCGSCHGLTMKGGLGPPLLPAALGGKPEDYLVEAILHGIPDTAMPPWAFEITRSEAAWLVRRLREGLQP